ncbi:MAG: SdiA-regulated domain-containing protein [Haliscomenobacter sp.]|nr:SdiA-regulated domain-containing protein [Haliscomenobacter sp.]
MANRPWSGWVVFLAFSPVFLACGQPATPVNPLGLCRQSVSAQGRWIADSFPYVLDEPTRTLTLAPELIEISGLALSPDGKYLVCLQDELATLFFLDPQTGSIEKRISFGKEGDYEGVETVGQELFAVRNSGAVVRVRMENGAFKEKETFKNVLNSENDIEGLGYDSVRNSLLLACKGLGGQGHGFAGKKSIYALDLNTFALDSIPALCIEYDSLKTYLESQPDLPKSDDLLKDLGSSPEDFSFSPSGIAVHPLSGHWYLISAKERTLLVVRPENGQIIHLAKLKGKQLEQPEGICFDEKANLYISSEGKDRAPVVQVYVRR